MRPGLAFVSDRFFPGDIIATGGGFFAGGFGGDGVLKAGPDENELNPTLTNAIDSSLWELYSQKNHYHAPVSTMTRIFEEAFTRPNYALEDFLDHTYNTVCTLALFIPKGTDHISPAL